MPYNFKMLEIILLLGCSLLNAITQLLIKFGAVRLEKTASLGTLLLSVLSTPLIWGVFCLQALSMGLWMFALMRVELSFAIPFIALSYVFVALGAWYFLGDTLPWSRVIGIGLICCGVIYVAKN